MKIDPEEEDRNLLVRGSTVIESIVVKEGVEVFIRTSFSGQSKRPGEGWVVNPVERFHVSFSRPLPSDRQDGEQALLVFVGRFDDGEKNPSLQWVMLRAKERRLFLFLADVAFRAYEEAYVV